MSATMSRVILAASILLLTACASAPQRSALAEPEPAPSTPAAPEPAPEPGATSDAPPPVAAAEPSPEPVAASEPEAPPPEEAAPSAPAAKEQEGTLVARKGKTVRIKVDDAASASVDQHATLLRYFNGKSGQKTPLGALAGIFGGNATVSGWLAIADVRVQKIDGNTVTLEIEQEQANIVMNGKKVNHFSPGAKVKLALKSAP
jgi:hypothetical protein